MDDLNKQTFGYHAMSDVVTGGDNVGFCFICGAHTLHDGSCSDRMMRCARSSMDGLGYLAECQPFIESLQAAKAAKLNRSRFSRFVSWLKAKRPALG